MNAQGAVIFFDTVGDTLIPVSLELISFAKYVCPRFPLRGVIMGKNISSAGEMIARESGIDIIAVESDNFYMPHPMLMCAAAAEIISEYNPEYICFTHTPVNSAAAASLAVKLECPCATGVESVRIENDYSQITRSVFNGKLAQNVTLPRGKKILTVLQGAYPPVEAEKYAGVQGSVTRKKFIAAERKIIPLELSTEMNTGVNLEEADVIISAGRGIGVEDNLELVNRLASVFKNSAIAASRPLCDLKWLPYSRQVGATGKTVSPKLYIALGISGSQQHIAGMKMSQCIAAVNTDPQAAIFAVADYKIVEDAVQFIPLLIQAAQKYR